MKNSLRILLIANSNEIGGGNRSLETLSLGLRQTGHIPFIVFPKEGPATDLFRSHGLNVFINPLTQPSIKGLYASVSSFLTWHQLIRSHAIDIIHTNGTIASRSVLWAGKVNGKPIVCHLRFDFGCEYYQWAFKYLPSPNCFIFVSRSMENSIKPSLLKNSASAKYTVVHNAVILSDKEIAPISENVNRIGIIANLQKIKGHEDFFNMAKALLAIHPHLHFDVIGSDVQNAGREDALAAFVAELKIDKHVTFHGHLNDVYSVIDDLDLVICPSHEEPFGRCAIEAMSRGKPVVVTNVGGLPEIVEDKTNGFIVPSKSPDALVKAVSELIENKEIRQSMSKQNISKVHEHFSQKGHTEYILDLYAEQLQTGDQP